MSNSIIGTKRWPLAGVFLAALLLVLPAPWVPVYAQELTGLETEEEKDPTLAKFDSTMRDVVLLLRAHDEPGLREFCRERELVYEGDSISIEILLEGEEYRPEVLQFLVDGDAEVIGVYRNFVAAAVPPERLEELSQLPEVRFISAPQRLRPLTQGEISGVEELLSRLIQSFLEILESDEPEEEQSPEEAQPQEQR